MMWINGQGEIYAGDCRVGDREATDEEVAAWEESRAAIPAPVDPVEKLRTFLAANPDVARLLK